MAYEMAYVLTNDNGEQIEVHGIGETPDGWVTVRDSAGKVFDVDPAYLQV